MIHPLAGTSAAYPCAILGRSAGGCGIHVWCGDPRQAEVGITLAGAFHGRGLAPETLKVVFDYLFMKLGKHLDYGSADPGNVPSLAFLERADMRREAHVAESLWFMGAWADEVIYAVLWREHVGDRGI